MAGRITRIDIPNTGIRKLMQTASLVSDRAAAVKDACNSDTGRDDFEYEVSVSAVRARGIVWAPAGEDPNVLIRNLDAGG